MDKLVYGLLVMVVGLVIVFTGLVLLMLCIKLLKLLMGQKQPKAAPVAPTPAAAQPVAAPEPAAQRDEGELVAAIAAAIAAMLDTQPGNLVIRRIERVGGSSWARANRLEQLQNIDA